MADATTVYDVVTRYSLEDRASGPMQNVERRSAATNRSLVALATTSGSLSRRLGGVGLAFGALASRILPVTSAAGAATAGVFGMVKAMRALNEEAERVTQLGASFNLAFRFDSDPIRNFTASLIESGKLVRGIQADAARLPGESRDFFGIASMIATPTFRAGRGPDDLRRMIGNTAIMAPFLSQSPADAGAGLMRALIGSAGADVPIFRNLQAAGLLPDAASFNALPIAQRFELLDTAMTKLAGNPLFRERVDRLLSTQWGTLQDTLFGPMGLFGQLSRGPFRALGPALSTVNEAISVATPGIVSGFRLVGGAMSDLARELSGPASVIGRWVGGVLGPMGRALQNKSLDRESRDLFRNLYEAGGIPWTAAAKQLPGHWALQPYLESLLRGSESGKYSYYAVGDAAELAATRLGLARQSGATFTPLGILGEMQRAFIEQVGTRELNPREDLALPNTNVTQNFTINLNLKSDMSPEGIVVAMEKAIAQRARTPTRGALGLKAVPSLSGVR